MTSPTNLPGLLTESYEPSVRPVVSTISKFNFRRSKGLAAAAVCIFALLGTASLSAQDGNGTDDNSTGGNFDGNNSLPKWPPIGPPPPAELPPPPQPDDDPLLPLPLSEVPPLPDWDSLSSFQISHNPAKFEYIQGTLRGDWSCTKIRWKWVRGLGHPLSRGYWDGTRHCNRYDQHVVVYSYEQVYIQGDQLGFLKLYRRVIAPECAPLSNVFGMVTSDTSYASGSSNGEAWLVTSYLTIDTATCS